MLYYKKYSIVILLLFVLNDALVIAQLPFYDNFKIISYFDYLTGCSDLWTFVPHCEGTPNCTTLTLNTNNANKCEGLGSYQINYTFNNTAQSVTLSKFFGYYVQDYDFNSDGLRLWVKGSVGNTDRLRIVLFEDTNMDSAGYYSEEIYEYVNNTALSNATGAYVDIPFAAFTKFNSIEFNNQLDKNRIGGIWISIVSNSNTTNSHTVYLDELSWTLNNLPPTQGNAYLQGTFLPLHTFNLATLHWNSLQWEAEIQRMQELKMTYAVIQYSQVFDINNNSAGHSYYKETNSYGMNQWNNSLTASTIDSIFKAANAKQFKIFVGLNYDSNYWHSNISIYNNNYFYDTLYYRQQNVVDEIHTKFGNNPSFEGWYIPQEFYNVWFPQAYLQPLAQHFRDISSYCKSKNTAKKVLISPFFTSGVPTDAIENWYNQFFSTINNGAINIDYCYVQDAVGQNHNKTGVEISQFLPHIKNACENHNVTFGVTIETFLQPQSCPIDSLGWENNATLNMNYRYFNHHDTIPFGLKHQMWEACNFTPNLMGFSWNDFISTKSNQSLYNDYKQYIINTQSSIIGSSNVCMNELFTYTVPYSPTIQYNWSVAPNGSGTIISGGTVNDNTISMQWNINGAGVISLNRLSQ